MPTNSPAPFPKEVSKNTLELDTINDGHTIHLHMAVIYTVAMLFLTAMVTRPALCVNRSKKASEWSPNRSTGRSGVHLASKLRYLKSFVFIEECL